MGAACQGNSVAINGEQTASEASSRSDEAERQTKDEEAESRCVALAVPGEEETAHELTSVNGSQDDLVLEERRNRNSGCKRKPDGVGLYH